MATSDLHGLCAGLQEACEIFCPAVLVIAGDLHPAVIGTDPDDWFRNTFFPIVSKLRCEVVAIPGNHDFWLASHSQHIFGTSSKNDIAKIAPKNFHLLLVSIGEVVNVDGQKHVTTVFYGTLELKTVF